LSCVTPIVDGLRKPIVVAAYDGFDLTAVRRRIVTVIVASCARAARVIGAVKDARTKVQIDMDRRDTGLTRGSVRTWLAVERRRRRQANPIRAREPALATPPQPLPAAGVPPE
jgi:hypothetical protein